ncbi:amidohydrolase [Aeromicrobium sp. YIM 150415]|uniref:amidohydrolase family protein n=1 Tax=Aeromicrobium sp. YIM 150415 TaxID=2803912 RepID=UPI001963BF26|nr:amidohydrolase family protein [Aeromicrobium sp. YIM 150415]MBM9464064.1 amidohydrolase [Aeromicrobium sp. YIM 150415]
MTTSFLGATPRASVWTGDLVDVDVHAQVPSAEALFPYLAQQWIDWCTERNWKAPAGVAQHFPANSPRTCRPQWRPADGGPPASSLALLQEHILNPWEVDTAILNCYYGIDSIRQPDWSNAMASAVNDWLVAEWLERDERLRGSLVLPVRDPEAMVREIHRLGDHPGIVQVLLPSRSDLLWGRRLYLPVFRAIAEHELVVGLHYGGTADGVPSTTGYPSYYIEEYAAEWQSFATQVTSMIIEGLFQEIPELRVSVLEGGFLWLPAWGWRMNKDWKGLRREVPWLKEPPFDLIRRHMRFSVAPAELGPREQLETTLSWLRSDDLLMFATDYPRGHDDDVTDLLQALPEEARPRLMSQNARDWYRL